LITIINAHNVVRHFFAQRPINPFISDGKLKSRNENKEGFFFLLINLDSRLHIKMGSVEDGPQLPCCSWETLIIRQVTSQYTYNSSDNHLFLYFYYTHHPEKGKMAYHVEEHLTFSLYILRIGEEEKTLNAFITSQEKR